MIRARSSENRAALTCFSRYDHVISPAFSILRQELDSMVRVIYLLSIKDLSFRKSLIECTLKGTKWKVITPKGKHIAITDHEMVDLANKLKGWAKSVYKFSCGFIHLSILHDHHATNPFEYLTQSEKKDILQHLRYYHGGPVTDNPSMQELSLYVPMIFDKISSNLECYLKQLENNEFIDK